MTKPWENNWEYVKNLGQGGQGGQGSTILVNSKQDPLFLAVSKTLNNNSSMSARSRMRREVASLGSLSIEIIKVPRVYEDNTSDFEDKAIELYFVMEYISGITLKEHVANATRIPVHSAIDMTLDLCTTVSEAHKRNVIHRDIKPDNIVVRDAVSHDLVIVDYGLSYTHTDQTEKDLSRPTERFQNSFIALPETNVPGDDHRDKRSDITALIAIFFYLLTGEKPGQIQDANGKMPHQRPRGSIYEYHRDEHRVDLINSLFSKGFLMEVDRRYQSVDEVSELLRTLKNKGRITFTIHNIDGKQSNLPGHDVLSDSMRVSITVPPHRSIKSSLVLHFGCRGKDGFVFIGWMVSTKENAVGDKDSHEPPKQVFNFRIDDCNENLLKSIVSETVALVLKKTFDLERSLGMIAVS